jgi:WD40 repeat protein
MQLNGHKKNVWDVQFSPVEKQIVSVGGDNLIKIWNLN